MGDDVVAVDGRLNRITAVVMTEIAAPRYIVVATGRVWRRHPVVPTALVTDVETKVVRVRGTRRNLRRLAEFFPLVI